MADAPWRCSQCGTVNAPSANACRTCGRWPSLFDLQSGAVDTGSETRDASAPTNAGEEETELPRYAGEPTVADEPRVADEPAAPEPRTSADSASGSDESVSPSPSGGPGRTGTDWRGPEPSIPQTPAGPWVRRLRLLVPLAVLVYVLISALRH